MAYVANESQVGGKERDNGGHGKRLCRLRVLQCTQETFEDGSVLTWQIS